MFEIEVNRDQDQANTVRWCRNNFDNRFKHHYIFDNVTITWRLFLGFFNEEDYVWYLINQDQI